MTHDPDLEYAARMGFSWFGGTLPPERNKVSLTVLQLAERLEEVARELHMAYQNTETRIDNILVALTLLDILQAEID
jgi:hypothetical protein